jgi:hypothetical protein
MLCVAEVFRRMFVLRVVTAADVPARETESQVHPIITPLQAILASVGGGFDLLDLSSVRADHRLPPFSSQAAKNL